MIDNLALEMYRVAADAAPDVVVKKMKYDHQGRLLADTTVLNSAAPAVVSYQYDDLGTVAGKVYGTGADAMRETFKYNIQGWLTDKKSKYFDIHLGYYDRLADVTGMDYYSGNINEFIWSHKGGGVAPGHSMNAFSCYYDGFGRLKEVECTIGDHLMDEGYYDKSFFFGEKDITYDKMGNILTLKRFEADSIVSDLRYVYDTGRLVALNPQNVEDRHYEYDYRGNLTLDRNKGLQFRYNYLNLLKQVNATDADNTLRARYLYSNEGVKLGVKDGIGNAGYEYIGSLVYRREGNNLTLESVPFGGGRIVKSSGGYGIQYYLTDHLGSVRVIVDQNGEVIERNDYFPFGKRRDVAEFPVSTNRYKFSGKESQTTGELGLLDFGARMYDAEIGRWWNMDPLADKFCNVSPYAYCFNNPVRFADKEGQHPVVVVGGVALGAVDLLLISTGVVTTGVILQKANDGSFVQWSDNVMNMAQSVDWGLWKKQKSDDYKVEKKLREQQAEVQKSIDENTPDPSPDGGSNPKRPFRTKLAKALGISTLGVFVLSDAKEPTLNSGDKIKSPERLKSEAYEKEQKQKEEEKRKRYEKEDHGTQGSDDNDIDDF